MNIVLKHNLKKDIEKLIAESLGDHENYIIGIADLRECADEVFGEYKYGISIGKRLDDDIIEQVKLEPSQDYLRLYDEVNQELSELIKKITCELVNNKFSCISIPPIPEDMDSKEQLEFNKSLRYKISHKMIATRAGLGWIGKTSLFISKRFGPRVRLSSILIKEYLPNCGSPINSSMCGTCNICVEKCPVNAANGKLWTIDVDRDEFLNAHKCRKYIFSNYYRKNIMLCGICVANCPIGEHNDEYIYVD
jgi:epoxyqueuosine reductase QueG